MRSELRAKRHDGLFDQGAMAGSFLRMEMLLEQQPEFIRHNQLPAWFVTMGDLWCMCDRIGPHTAALRAILLAGEEYWHHLMDDAEDEAWQALPELVTIYRGCGVINRLGLSWTLDRKQAEEFPFLDRYKQNKPRMLTAIVPKSQIVAVKLGREEHEVIALVEESDIVEDIDAVAPQAKNEPVKKSVRRVKPDDKQRA
jgi:hypothetical protein